MFSNFSWCARMRVKIWWQNVLMLLLLKSKCKYLHKCAQCLHIVVECDSFCFLKWSKNSVSSLYSIESNLLCFRFDWGHMLKEMVNLVRYIVSPCCLISYIICVLCMWCFFKKKKYHWSSIKMLQPNWYLVFWNACVRMYG